MTADVRVCVVGAALDTGNLGVSALGTAVVAGLAQRLPGARITLFDNGRGDGPLKLDVGGQDVVLQRRGAWFSKRLQRPESLIAGALQAMVGVHLNPIVRDLAHATAVVDISGGDSFSDIYGLKRFAMIALPKRLTLHLGTPLMLLPQTYGPFQGSHTRHIARGIVRRADRAWARDPESFAALRRLAGDGFDHERHRESVDVSFALPSTPPSDTLAATSWDGEVPVVGVNVSGLLCNDVAGAASRFGLRADVREASLALVERFLADGVRVLLVPHVRGDSAESDDRACAEVQRNADPSGERLRILPPGLGASETKWYIAGTEWLIGGRMHATIAALSSCVPVAGIAYSDKFAGVFDRCGVGDQALDARTMSTAELVDAAWASWQQRETVAARLEAYVPGVIATAEAGLDELAYRIRSHAGRPLR